MLTLIEENYLKAMYHLSELDGLVSVNELSKHLNIKMPTVNSMMKKMAEKGLVIYESYKPLKLTDYGTITAALIIRKHRLTEMYLVEKMGFSWDQVHDIAEQMEHINSSAFFDKMDELLDYPQFDPHGSPIPNKDGLVAKNDFFRLCAAHIGDEVVVRAVTNSTEDFLKYLSSKNIALGTKLYIIHKEDYDSSMIIRVNQLDIAMSSKITEKLLVNKKS